MAPQPGPLSSGDGGSGLFLGLAGGGIALYEVTRRRSEPVGDQVHVMNKAGDRA